MRLMPKHSRGSHGFPAALKRFSGDSSRTGGGLVRVKINCVVLRGFNDDQIVPFAEFSREQGVIVRFIEFMRLEEDRLWTPETVVPFPEVVSRLEKFRPLVRFAPEGLRRDGATLHL